jgi:hypothetical protein
VTKRRSLDDALITPEEAAFLSAGIAATENPIPNEPAKIQVEPPTVQPEVRAIQKPAEGGLVSLNIRIAPPIMAALLRASMERKIQRLEPFTQRDIVSEALAVWLKTNGYA